MIGFMRTGIPWDKYIFCCRFYTIKNYYNCLFSTFTSNSALVEANQNSELLLSTTNLEKQIQNEHAVQLSRKEVLNKYLKPKRNYVPLFNFAAYINKNSTLQELVKLGVNLHKIEITKGAQELILKLDFERDIRKYLIFLHDIGVAADDLGLFITKNPFIFKEDLDNLQVRINYLESKDFTPENISRILTKNPCWLLFKTQNIDDRLGYFQNKFMLNGSEVRHVAVRMPKIVTFDIDHIEGTYFSVKEEMGFKEEELRELILKKPKIYTLERRDLVDRFDYLHNTMGLKHNQLILQPGIFLCRLSRLKERHQFLKSLGRNQYDPTKSGYIAPLSVIANTDVQFCKSVAKVSVLTYNRFLKTLC